MPQVNIDVDPTTEASPARIKPDSDTPFRIAILGDFSGRARKQSFLAAFDLAARATTSI